MKATQKTLGILLAVLCISQTLLLSGCGGSTAGQESVPQTSAPVENEDYEFDFAGKDQFDDGREYTIRIKGEKWTGEAETPFLLTIDEMGAFELPGTYTYVENKGYKLYFEDVGAQFVYTAYDPDTEEMSFRYKVDLGEALGARSIVFTDQNSAFKDVYDGIGLGPTPPTFEGSGWGGYLGQFEIAPAVLRCYEDGTAMFTATAVTAVDPKAGTWDYDEENDRYHFTFPSQTFANSEQIEVQPDGTIGYKTIHGEGDVRFDRTSEVTPTEFYATFNEATGNHELELEIVWYVYSIIYMTYTK